jgi:DNA-binding winged helix-turn-helix (wHTH) protein
METARNTVRFGEFTFDGDTRRLLRGGAEIHLSPKAFELLLILVSNRPKALSKADLQAQLWPDAFVTEANLSGLVKEIRHALGDDPRHPRFVRTLHGFGYAFDAPVEDTVPQSAVAMTDTTTYWILGEGRIRLVEGTNILGRDAEATIWFDRPGVSRLHARVVVGPHGATLEDLGSTNGTWLRGERVVAPTALRDGDDIRLGPVVVTFRVRRAAASTEAL